MGLRKLLGSTFVVAALVVAFFAAPAMAASVTFKVQTKVDGNQANPGTTQCATASDSGTGGKCTLRSSIEAADNEPSGTNVTIDVPADTYKFSVPNPVCIQCAPVQGSSYQLEILSGPSSINIVGAGSSSTIIDANSLDRVFEIAAGATATISAVTIEHGRPGGLGNISTCPAQPQAEADGGGILDDGSRLSLIGDVIKDNIASGGGGGIDENGQHLLMTGTDVSNNLACQSNGSFRDGGGIDVTGGDTVDVSSSTISGNSAEPNGDGGGMGEESKPATMNVRDSTISKNSAYEGGGMGADGRGVWNLYGDTLNDNTALNFGGGFNDFGPDTDTFVNTTITGNHAASDGGGIFTFGSESISFSTIVGNFSPGGVGNLGVELGGEKRPPAVRQQASGFGYTLDDTIVAKGNNDASNCEGPFAFTDDGHNLFDDTSDSGAQCGSSPTSHDVITSDAKLGGLANNRGPTKTVALLAGSPAIDAASRSKCVSETKDRGGNPVDQRGIPRPEGAACDIGAFEVTPNLGVTASPQKDSILVGQQDTITDTINNSGPTNAVDSTFTDPAGGFKIDSVTTSQGTCTHATTTISCQLNTIPFHGKVTISFVITGVSAGTVVFHSHVATKDDDLIQANNHAETSVEVKKRPAPPPPAKPSVSIVHLGPACYPEKSTINFKAMARAAAGIKLLRLMVSGNGFSKRWDFTPASGKTVKRQTLREHAQGSALMGGHTYRVTAKVVDKLGRTDGAHTTFTVCKPPKRGFTG